MLVQILGRGLIAGPLILFLSIGSSFGSTSPISPETQLSNVAQQDLWQHAHYSGVGASRIRRCFTIKIQLSGFLFYGCSATFHGRKPDATASELIKAGKIPATIFVGIDNGGSTIESKNPGS